MMSLNVYVKIILVTFVNYGLGYTNYKSTISFIHYISADNALIKDHSCQQQTKVFTSDVDEKLPRDSNFEVIVL